MAKRKETIIKMEVKVAYPGPGASWVEMKERLKGEITAAFQAFNNPTPDLRLPTIKEIERVEGNDYERLLIFEGSAESAETNTILRNLIAYFSVQDRDFFRRALEFQPYATCLVIYGLATKDFHSINELVVNILIKKKSLNWVERKTRSLVGRAVEHGKPPVQVEFKTAADTKRAILNLNLEEKPLIVKKYYIRAKTVAVPGAPTRPRLQFRGTPLWDNRRASREREGQDNTR